MEHPLASLNSPQTERALIGSVAACPENFLSVGWLESQCFYDERNVKIWSAIKKIFNEGKKFDIWAVHNELKKQGEADQLAVDYLMELHRDGIAAEDSDGHASFIHELHVKRTMYGFLISKASELASLTTNPEDILTDISGKILKISHGEDDNTKKIIDIVPEVRKLVLGRKHGEEGVDDVSTGLPGIIIPNGLVVIAARPSMGKSSFCVQLCNNIGIDQNLPVVIFELEMSRGQLLRWIISQRTQIDNERLRRGEITDQEEHVFEQEIGRIERSGLFIDDTPSLNVFQLKSRAVRLKNKHDIKMIVIDYLQLMSGVETRGRIKNRENEVSEISRQLKIIQKELNIPIIAVSQLNRAVEARSDKIPRLSDLRESGSLEQDADMVMFIHRPEYYGIREIDGKSTENLAQIMTEKYRDGALSWKELRFIPRTVTFKKSYDIPDDPY